MGDRKPLIVIADDSEADLELMREAFIEGDVDATLETLSDGAKVLERLRDPQAQRPQLVLLDLHMGAVDGHTILAQIKADERLRSIPVVIMTSSSDQADIDQAYGNAANTYVIKPHQWGRLLNTVKSLEQFWLNAARLPGQPAA